jgi:probable F420-dependent oxidoreductase
MTDAGYTDLWTAEASGTDGVTPLAAAAVAAPEAQLGTAILPAQTRGPALLAMTAAGLAGLAPGRFTLGIGASSPAIVEQWNGIGYARPFERTRDVLRFLRLALAGERVDHAFSTFTVRGFRLTEVPEQAPQIMLAALRPGMLRLAAEEADGAILNWLSAADVARVREVTGPDLPLVARIFVCVSTDADTVRAHARRLVAAYLTVPAYAAQQEWLGRGGALVEMNERWAAGDRRGALQVVPDEVVDELIVHGDATTCRRRILEYVDQGIDVPVVYAMPFGVEPIETARAMAPRPRRDGDLDD